MSATADRVAGQIASRGEVRPGDSPEESTDRLLLELAERARAEAEAVLQAARDEAAAIRAAADARCAEAHRAALRECEDAAAAAHAQTLAAARLDGRRTVLQAQHAAVDRVLHAVMDCARAAAAVRCPSDAIVRARVADVLSYLEGDPAEIWCSPRMVVRVAAAVNDANVVVREDASIIAGVRARTTDGRVLVDDTLEAWLAHELPRLRIEICRGLESRP